MPSPRSTKIKTLIALLVFPAALALELSASPSDSPARDGVGLLSHHWIVDEREKSSAGGSMTVIFALMGTSEGESNGVFPMLILAYGEHHWKAVFNPTQQYLGPDDPVITLRWDQNPPETGSWGSSLDHTSAVAPFPKEFINRLLKTNKLVAGASSQPIDKKTVVFDVTGLAKEIAKYPEAMKALAD